MAAHLERESLELQLVLAELQNGTSLLQRYDQELAATHSRLYPEGSADDAKQCVDRRAALCGEQEYLACLAQRTGYRGDTLQKLWGGTSRPKPRWLKTVLRGRSDARLDQELRSLHQPREVLQPLHYDYSQLEPLPILKQPGCSHQPLPPLPASYIAEYDPGQAMRGLARGAEKCELWPASPPGPSATHRGGPAADPRPQSSRGGSLRSFPCMDPWQEGAQTARQLGEGMRSRRRRPVMQPPRLASQWGDYQMHATPRMVEHCHRHFERPLQARRACESILFADMTAAGLGPRESQIQGMMGPRRKLVAR